MPTPFNGYHQPRAGVEDHELTHVARGTPGGEYLRRQWHPIALASEVHDLPVPLRVLGEDLVLFRAGQAYGLLHRHCAHRGASLEFGSVSARGIRCCYHGWLYAVDGTLLETPAEPTRRLCETVTQGAYPVREHAGLLFAYLGPPEATPPLPIYDSWVNEPDHQMVPFKLSYACNWLQVHENTADPMHIPFLHGRQFSLGFNELPVLSFCDTPLGLVVASSRCVDGKVWVRTADVMLANCAQYPPAFETGERERVLVGAWATRWIVPVDDTHCWVVGYRHFNRRLDPNGQGRPEAIGLERVDFAGQVAQHGEDRQRNPGDYEAMVGQGPIALHDHEHLCASDRGVARFRRLLRQAIREGGSPSTGTTTYTCEVIMPCTSASPALLAAVGEGVLGALVASTGRDHAEREAQVRRFMDEVLACP